MSFSTPLFTEWLPWTSPGDGTPKELDAKLGTVGCYLLARFVGRPSPDDELDAALAPATDRPRAEAAATSIVQRLAVAMHYSPTRRAGLTRYGDWSGAERVLGRECLYLGWYVADLSAVALRVDEGDTPVHDGGAARNRDELRAMLQAFWEAWHP
jgi:hypothetical protein